MVRDQRRVLADVFEHLGVDSTFGAVDVCVKASSFRSMSRGRKRGQEDPSAMVRKGTPGDWRTYFTRRDGEMFDRTAGDLLVRLGYETDASWVDGLPATLDAGG
jgi:hypothetical protein